MHSPMNPNNWFVLQTTPGFEINLKTAIERFTRNKELNNLIIMCRHSPIEKSIYPIRQNNDFAKVASDEMAFLLQLAGKKGIVEISKIQLDTTQNITIVDGPLKDCQGRILFMNKRKHKAKISLKLLNRKIPITLGLEIIKNTDEVKK